MDLELVMQRFNSLPESLQFQVFDYIEFLLSKYAEKTNIGQKKNYQEEISPELKLLLEERMENYKKNPNRVKSWKEVEQRLLKKYNYEV